MTVKWGDAKGSGATKFRVGIDVSIPTPTVNDTAVTVTTYVWIWTKDKVTDPAVSLTVGGTGATAATTSVAVNTPSNSDWSTSNKKLVHTSTRSIATSATAQSLTFTASATGLDAATATTVASYSRTETLKASPAAPPAAPTGLSVSAGGVLTWTNTAPTNAKAPYRNIEIQRWDNVRAAWYSLVKIGVATSFTDTTRLVDRRYRYQVRASNGGGVSAWLTQAGSTETVPATPAAPTARRPVTNVEISWVNTSTIATAHEVWHAVDGILDPTPLATVALPGSSYTHVAPSGNVSHTYFLKAVGVQTSPLGPASIPVVPFSAPLAPSNLVPSGTIVDAAAPLMLEWDANPSDGTTQVGFKPKWRQQGAATWTAPAGQVLSASASTSTHLVTCAGHYLNQGDTVRFTGDPPAPLVAGTQYFALPISETQFRVCSTEENAEVGIAMTLSSSGGSFSVQNGRIVSNTSSYTIAAGSLAAGLAYEWTVSTDARYTGTNPSSEFAQMGGFRTATKPTLTFSSPEDGGTTGSPHAMAAWAFYSPDAGVVQQWAQVALYQGTTLLEIYEASGEWFVYNFVTDLTNGATYRIEAQAEGSNGIRTDVHATTFTAEYVGPATPGLSLMWDMDEGYVVIDIDNPSDGDSPDVVSNTIYRSVGGEPFVQAVAGVAPNSTAIDYLPTPNKVNTYRVAALAEDGTITTYEAAVTCDNMGDWFWLNGGPSWDVRAKVRYEGGTDITLSPDTALYDFAGRTSPTAFSGPAIRYTINLSALLTRDDEGYATFDDFHTLIRQGGNVWYRDPVGRSLRCSLGDVEFNDSNSLIEFRATLTEVSK